MKKLSSKYNPKEFEGKIYKKWEAEKAFSSSPDFKKKSFTIVMPPPNITGRLHMGHALDQTLQDLLTRFKRMDGYEALWLPGTDHASIATEVKVAEEIYNTEGKTKDELGRAEFLKRAWKWKEKYGREIVDQMKKLGNSCDWEKERFTMDEGLSKAVSELFVRYYNEGLIYKGKRLINYCPECGTSLSDAEVEHEDIEGTYWYYRYPSEDGSFEINIATSRPETMFGDTAIAVHPDDKRYKDLVGKEVILPIVGRKIPIIADTYPDPEKGTGAVKITPAHDVNDFEVGKRNSLDSIEIMNEDGTLNPEAGKYEGLDRYEVRKAWTKELAENGFLIKLEKQVIPTGKCYRCNTIVEPLLSEQWFVKMDNLAKEALALITEKNGQKDLNFIPSRFENTYKRWLEEIRDWCISRQLWWGHRIPAYYCDDCNEIIVSLEKSDICPKCNSKNLKQDEDVLDTWFSSALWPFSTLGWPDKTKNLDYYFPTSTLVTGYDIIFFWVVRMAFSSAHIMNKTPFDKVLVHGLVRDEQGRKMSKSLGNGIDPLKIIDEYGADALRFTLIQGTSAGNDMRFSEEKLLFSRNFANKIWNATRFVLMNQEIKKPNFDELDIKDKWMIHLLNNEIKDIRRNLESYDLSVAAEKIYSLIWNEFCDWYIEFSKTNEKDNGLIIYILKELLSLLHPFMPFITEEIWGTLITLNSKETSLIRSPYPIYKEKFIFEKEYNEIEIIKEIIREIRNIRAENNIPQNKKFPVQIIAKNNEIKKIIESQKNQILNLSKVSDINFIDNADENAISKVSLNAEIFVQTEDIIDKEEEVKKIKKELVRLNSSIENRKKKLANKDFVDKAPEKVINIEKEKLNNDIELNEKLEKRLVGFSN